MWLAEVDKDGYVVATAIRDVDRENYKVKEQGNRLVVDPLPLPSDYNARFVYPVRVEPVVGDLIQYTFKERQLEIPPPEEQAVIDSSLQIAKDFLESKGIDASHLFYFVTVYNADMRRDIAMAFSSGIYNKYNVKVSLLTNSVSEWYEVGDIVIDNEHYIGVSKDLETGEVIDKYKLIDSGQAKYTPDGKIVMTYPFEIKPTDPIQAKILSDFAYLEKGDFKYRNHITAWSNKENGFIIQYDRLLKQR